jgi:hypothetical protein
MYQPLVCHRHGRAMLKLRTSNIIIQKIQEDLVPAVVVVETGQTEAAVGGRIKTREYYLHVYAIISLSSHYCCMKQNL